MNWDLIVGLVIGLSGSILGLISTIITNKQNHKHEIEMMKQNHSREVEILIKNQKDEFKRFILENSFKEYELKANALTSENNHGSKIYPFDMYLASYLKIGNYLQNEDPDHLELNHLINELKNIKDMYDSAPYLGR